MRAGYDNIYSFIYPIFQDHTEIHRTNFLATTETFDARLARSQMTVGTFAEPMTHTEPPVAVICETHQTVTPDRTVSVSES